MFAFGFAYRLPASHGRFRRTVRVCREPTNRYIVKQGGSIVVYRRQEPPDWFADASQSVQATTMTGKPTTVASVSVDPPYTKLKEGRTRYRVTLACGCQWWEEHPTEGIAPQVGKVVRCYADHKPQKVSMAPDEIAVASDRGPANEAVLLESRLKTDSLRTSVRGSEPQRGDLLLRNTQDGNFVVLDAVSEHHIAGPVAGLEQAIDVAREHGAVTVWHQCVDERGRALGPPARLAALK